MAGAIRCTTSMVTTYYPCLEHIQQQPACNLLYVKQQEGCYIILVYEIPLVIESLFLYHNANGRRSPRKEALADYSLIVA